MNLDLTKLSNQKRGTGGDRRTIKYIIPVRIAEHLAMASNTAIAHKIRDIFIDIKNRYLAEKDAEKALWDNPDYAIPRALQMAEKRIKEFHIALND